MQKLFLIVCCLFSCIATQAQYQYRGQVFSAIRQTTIGFGMVRLPSPPRSGRDGKVLAKIDSLGFFSFSLNDTANVWVVVDCWLSGSTMERLFYSDTAAKIWLYTDCTDYHAERAKKDIEKNEPSLLCHLGYATYEFDAADSIFEKKYGVSYHTFADEPILTDCMWLYNTTIAGYLDKKYGTAWRKEVRWDVPFK